MEGACSVWGTCLCQCQVATAQLLASAQLWSWVPNPRPQSCCCSSLENELPQNPLHLLHDHRRPFLLVFKEKSYSWALFSPYWIVRWARRACRRASLWLSCSSCHLGATYFFVKRNWIYLGILATVEPRPCLANRYVAALEAPALPCWCDPCSSHGHEYRKSRWKVSPWEMWEASTPVTSPRPVVVQGEIGFRSRLKHSSLGCV